MTHAQTSEDRLAGYWLATDSSHHFLSVEWVGGSGSHCRWRRSNKRVSFWVARGDLFWDKDAAVNHCLLGVGTYWLFTIVEQLAWYMSFKTLVLATDDKHRHSVQPVHSPLGRRTVLSCAAFNMCMLNLLNGGPILISWLSLNHAFPSGYEKLPKCEFHLSKSLCFNSIVWWQQVGWILQHYKISQTQPGGQGSWISLKRFRITSK